MRLGSRHRGDKKLVKRLIEISDGKRQIENRNELEDNIKTDLKKQDKKECELDKSGSRKDSGKMLLSKGVTSLWVL
jgi:hypothetical protein